MKLYTAKVLAAWLDLTEKRVKQLTKEGVLEEKRPGLYELRPNVVRYIRYKTGGANDLNTERALLVKAKREMADLDLKLRKGELHRSQDIEAAMTNIFLNFKIRLLALPGKLAPELANIRQKEEVFDRLTQVVNEALEELADYRITLEEEANE